MITSTREEPKKDNFQNLSSINMDEARRMFEEFHIRAELLKQKLSKGHKESA